MRRWPWVVVVTAIFVSGLSSPLWSDGPTAATPWLLPVATFALVGAVLTSRVPGNPLGPICLVFGVGAGATAILPYSLPFATTEQAAWAAAIGNALNTIAVIVSVIPLLLRFPDGRLLSRRWRLVEVVAVVTALIGATAALITGGWGGAAEQAIYESPLYSSLGHIADAIEPVFYILLLILLGIASVSVVIRFRAADGDSREQLRWLTTAAVILGIAAVAGGLGVASTEAQAWIISGAMSLLPLAIAVAVLRYRLYDLDLVISRTILFGILVAFITGVYAVVVVGLGSIVGGDENLALSIASTALVAVLFEPMRTRAQRWANRLVFGRRATPYEVLGDLTTRLAGAESHEGLLARMAQRLADGTGAERAAIWVPENGGYRLLAAHPPLGHTHQQEIAGWTAPIEHDGVPVGLLSIEPRRGESLSPTEARLAEDLAGSAGLVLNKARLDAELEAKARDLALSRRRQVGAEDNERQNLEQTLEGGVQQQVVALKLQIGMAARTAEAEGVEHVADLLEGMSGDAQAVIDQIRSLARGIFPPLLETGGLRSALLAILDQAPVETVLEIEEVGRLAREAEGAVYFAMSEAITNAIKHADAPIRVQLHRSDGAVEFAIADSGPGFDPATAVGGSGLANLADRIETAGGELRIDTTPASRTVVWARIPVGDDHLRSVSGDGRPE